MEATIGKQSFVQLMQLVPQSIRMPGVMVPSLPTGHRQVGNLIAENSEEFFLQMEINQYPMLFSKLWCFSRKPLAQLHGEFTQPILEIGGISKTDADA